MELPELKNRILDNNIPNFLIFTGDEIALKDIYIREIAKRLNLIMQPTDINDILNKYSNSLINEKYLYIVENNKDILNISDITNKFDNNNYLIYLVDKLDKRSKFFKENQDNIIEFNLLDSNTLLSIISSKFKLNDNNINWLIQACGNDYGKCLQELDKIKIFLDTTEDDANNIFEYIKSNGGFHEELPDIVFKFIDAVGARDKINSWKLYDILEKNGESKIEMLSLLYNRFRNTLIVQMINNPTFESTGLNSFQLYQGRLSKDKYSDNELFKNLELIKDIDANIKLGNIDESVSVKYALINIL